MLYVDAYAMDGGLLRGVALAAFGERYQLAVSTGCALGVVHPILYLVAAFPRLFGPKA